MPPTPTPPPPLVPSSTSSPLSSFTSFVTASASPRDLQDAGTDADADIDVDIDVDVPSTNDRSSSPTEPDISANPDPPCPYRKARRLPPELREHCRVYLEESLHQYTLNLLNSLLSSRRDSPRHPAYCPPPSQLSLLNTIVVHPDFTTRPKEHNWPEVAVESLIYLRSILSLFGPINAGFKEATRFTTSSAYSRNSTPESDTEPDDTQHDDRRDADERGLVRLSGKHSDGSIWRRGQDFFSVVGWAFNCSVLYPSRWRHWKQWLGFMLELIESDLEERRRLDMESGQDDRPHLRDSILAGYLSQRSGRSAGNVKSIMKAIFADGSKSASSLFQEVWYKEHKGMSHTALNKRKRERVNIEKGDFGSWLDNDSVYSSQASEPPTPQKRRTNSGRVDRSDFQALEPTFMESVPLRQRLFSALSYLCFYLPSPPLDLTDLYETFETAIKSQPLPIFAALVSHPTSALRVESQITILRSITELFMPSSALSPAKVDRARHDAGGISPPILERCFLPYPANTIAPDDNAKLALLLENLLQISWCGAAASEGERFDPRRLRDAARKGVDARETKAKRKKSIRGGRGGGAGAGAMDTAEEEARAVLEMSGQRLLALVEVIAEMAEEEEGEEMDEDGG
ncbi:hypothetical protein F5X96DRAFT_684747 [Biscogniauxia mediterranea]|nr:hypothetical protein F5X96DRAFT_684747 [Biscogniauxia mediterranea]